MGFLKRYEVKQLVEDLQKIKKEQCIIDLLKKYFKQENKELFEKEDKEDGKRKDKKIDIRWFTLRKLRSEWAAEMNIRIDCLELQDLKIIIFFRFVLRVFEKTREENTEDYERKIRKIIESKYVYSFYKGLVSNGICKLRRYQKAIKALNMDLTQEKLDNDQFRSEHDKAKREIIDKY